MSKISKIGFHTRVMIKGQMTSEIAAVNGFSFEQVDGGVVAKWIHKVNGKPHQHEALYPFANLAKIETDHIERTAEFCDLCKATLNGEALDAKTCTPCSVKAKAAKK